MKQKHISTILVLAITIAGIFIYGVLFLPTSAQIIMSGDNKNVNNSNTNSGGKVINPPGPPRGESVMVYWRQPFPNTPSMPVYEINGQRPFEVFLVPDNIAVSVVIDAYSMNATGGFDLIQQVHCGLNEVIDPTGAGTFWFDPECDTLSIENGIVYFGVRAFDDSGAELDLVNETPAFPHDTDGNPRFGPIGIANYFSMIIPGTLNGEQYTVSGIGDWTAQISGSVRSANLYLQEESHQDINYTLHLTDIIENGNNNSVWQRTWNSEYWGSGQYQVYLNFESLDGVTREGVISEAIILYNDIQAPPLLCTPDWQCEESDWAIACSEDADGNYSRRCNNPYDDDDCTGAPTPPFITEVCDCTVWSCPAWPATCPEGETLTRTCTNECNESDTQEWVCESSTVPPSEPEEDNSGNEQETASVTVTPVIQMNETLDGLQVPGPVTLYADVIEGDVNELEFYYDLLGGSTSANTGIFACTGGRLDTNPKTYQCTWDATDSENGIYGVYAKGFVINADGTINEYISNNSVQIEIDHGAPPQEDAVVQPAEVPAAVDPTTGEILSNEEFEALESQDEYLSEEERLEIDSEDISAGIVSEPTILLVRKADGKMVKIAFEEPLTKGKEVSRKLSVVKVENFSPVIGKNQIVFRGKGPADTWVTIFIYSSPIVVKTKTDSNGNFVYTLDKDLLDGKHEVYVTVTDEHGRISEKSSPMTFFIKRAQAVSEEEYLRGDVNVQEESAKIVANYLFIAIGIVIVVLVMLLTFYYFSKKKQSVA